MIVDDCYKYLLTNHKWSVNNKGYAHAWIQGKPWPLHRYIAFLAGLEIENKVVDHIDHNKLNCKLSNLRVATLSQNSCNREKPQVNNKSGLLGVSFFKRNGKWRTSVCKNGNRKSAGYYKNKYDAALARDMLALKMHGNFAKTNFDSRFYDTTLIAQ